MSKEKPLIELLNKAVTSCRRCPRLVSFRETVPKRASFKGEDYWRNPVPGFGDPEAWMLIAGLAPAAHGGNRTGRLFTGDPSAKFLMPALYEAGFANQPTSESLNDGLKFYGCYMTAAVKCVPPQNKPTAEEQSTCCGYFWKEIELLGNLKAVLAMGGLAHNAYIKYLKSRKVETRGVKFEHGKIWHFDGFPSLVDCYHPSPQNTYTGRLTHEMIMDVLNRTKELTVDP
ncbi:MAG: uracil-DNA glycosylase [Chlamydiota bacterium]|nr:uracil-DNA glycosylase [Chlamydiota bacterium]